MDIYEETRETFERNLYRIVSVAELIDGPVAYSKWLLWFLRPTLLGLTLDRCMEVRQPSRRELMTNMKQISSAADVLLKHLEDPHSHRFLNGKSSQPLNKASLDSSLVELRRRAQCAQSDQQISTPRGAARSGAGPARFPGGCSVKLWIAVIVSAAMEFRRGQRTCPRNVAACRAAEELWLASGGYSSGQPENAHASWRQHLKKANSDDWTWARDMFRNQLSFYKAVVGLREAALLQS